MVKRIYVEKKPEFSVEAKGLLKDLKENLLLENLEDLKIVNRYDVEGINDEIFEKAKEKGLKALDAPVTGGDIGAKNGTLTILVGGEEEDYKACLPIFQAMARAQGVCERARRSAPGRYADLCCARFRGSLGQPGAVPGG